MSQVRLFELEDIVFRTPTENKCYMLVFEDCKFEYLSEGKYGGFIGRRTDGKAVLVVLAVPNIIDRKAHYDLYNIAREVLGDKSFSEASGVELTAVVQRYLEKEHGIRLSKKALSILSVLLDKYIESTRNYSVCFLIEVVKYNYYIGKPVIQKVKEGAYVVYDVEYLGRSCEGLAVRFSLQFEGSRRRPRDYVASKVLNELKFKLPPDYMKYIYAESHGVDSFLRFKYVVRVPDLEKLVREVEGVEIPKNILDGFARVRVLVMSLYELPEAVEVKEEEKKFEVTAEEKRVEKVPTAVEERGEEAPTREVTEVTPVAEVKGIKGFIILKDLPSAGVLRETLPEIFADTKIGVKIIELVRGYFRNRIERLRTKWYDGLRRIGCYVIGFGNEKMYVLPADKLPKFLEFVREFKRELAEYQRELEMFLREGKLSPELEEKLKKGKVKIDLDYVQKVREYLSQYGIKEIKVPNVVDRFWYRLIPIVIDKDFALQIVQSEFIRKHGEEVWQKIKQDVIDEIERQRQQWIEDARKIIEEKLRDLGRAIKRARDKVIALEKVKKELPKIEELCKEVGVDPNEIDTLREIKVMVQEVERDRTKALEISARVYDILTSMVG